MTTDSKNEKYALKIWGVLDKKRYLLEHEQYVKGCQGEA